MMQANDENVMLYMGSDFTYDNARYVYGQLDTLIHYCNKFQTVNLTCIYSTPGEYVNALKKENVNWPVKTGGDFFPYEQKNVVDASGPTQVK